MYYIRNKAIFIIALFIWQLQPAKAQMDYSFNNFKEKKEAAITELKNFPRPDTARVSALIRILYTAIFLKERKEVSPYLAEALEISRKLKYKTGLANCYLQTAGYYKSASDYANAHIYYDSALYIAGNIQEEDLLAIKERALEQKGFIYYTQENYYAALDYFFESLKYPSSNIGERKMRIYMFITEIYLLLNNLDKATEYAEKNLTLVEEDADMRIHYSVYFSVIELYLKKNELKKAASYLDRMKPTIPDPKQVQVNFGYYLNRGKISYRENKHTDAYIYFQEANKYAVMGGHVSSKSISLCFLSRTALQLGYSEAAKMYAMENLSLAEKMNVKSGKIDALINLSDYYNKGGNKSKAFELLQQAMQLKDSFVSEANIKQLRAFGAIYEADKQEKEITKLQAEKEIQRISVKRKSTLNKVFIASIIALLVFGYLGYTNFRKGQQLGRHQQKLQSQKIAELEKDKQLLAIDAMLKGQEEERSRIAKDLHDGLGSLLSGTKLSFMNVKDSLVLTQKNTALFDKSLSMLDNTIGDLRKVAQNLMPEALVKFGLHEALRDFCDSIQSSSVIKIVFQKFGEKRNLNSTAEVFIYRIIQELVNNAVKHARANNIIVQLTMSIRKTGITVEDNGIGFDINNLPYTKGSGMANINYRVQYFNGTFDIVSLPGDGTSVHIELNV
jgi:two-component system, NarL family, sensor kinase